MKRANMVKRVFFCVMCLIFLSLLINPVIAQETDLLTEKVIVIDEAIEGETPRLISCPDSRAVAYDPNTVTYKPEIIDYDLWISTDELLIEPKLLFIAPGEGSYGLCDGAETGTGIAIEENPNDLLIPHKTLPLETREDSELVVDTHPNLISPEPVYSDANTLISPPPEPVSTKDEEPVKEEPVKEKATIIPRPIYPMPVITTSPLLISSALISTANPALISPEQVSTDTNSLPLLITSYTFKNRSYASSKNLSDYATYNSPINFDSRWATGYNEFSYLFNKNSNNNNNYSNYSLPLWPSFSSDAYPDFTWPGHDSSNYNNFGWFNSYNGFGWFED